MVLILHILSSLGTDGSFKEHNIENSVLSAAGRTVTPLLKPMGIDQENWPATVAVFTGILHKVVVISTLKTIYAETNHSGQQTEKTFEFWKAIKQSFKTIPMGIKKMLGINTAAKHEQSKSPFFTALHDNFHGQIGAYAYLLFVLLYFPCIATTSTAYKESSLGWAAFMLIWSTGIAYLTATLFYQLATFNQHPGETVAWGAGSAFFMVAVILGFLFWGKQKKL
jgi:ferrous iron transport protein B